MLTDAFGATPSRIAMQLADPMRVAVIAGVNLQMLCKALSKRTGPIDELSDELMRRARDAIVQLVDTGGEYWLLTCMCMCVYVPAG